MHFSASTFLAAALAVQSFPSPVERSEITALSLDRLIDRMPPVGADSTYDRATKQLEYHPVVAEFMRRLRDGATPNDRQWCDALIGTGVVRTHAKWPATEPFALSVQRPAWMPNTELRLDALHAGWRSVASDRLVQSTCGTCTSRDTRRALYQELGPLDLGSHELTFAAEIRTGEPPSFATSPPLLPIGFSWQGRMTIQVEVVPTIDDAMPPVSSEAVDRAVRASIGCAFSDWSDGRTAILVLDPDFSAFPVLARTALSIEVAVMRGDDVVETKSLRASDYDRTEVANSLSKASQKSIAFASVAAIPIDVESDPSARRGWHLRVKGLSNGVLRNWSATQRFGGTFDMPLDEAIRSEAERAGPKGRGPWGWLPGPR